MSSSDGSRFASSRAWSSATSYWADRSAAIAVARASASRRAVTSSIITSACGGAEPTCSGDAEASTKRGLPSAWRTQASIGPAPPPSSSDSSRCSPSSSSWPIGQPTSALAGWPLRRASERLAADSRPAASTMPIPSGASSNAARNRSSLSRRAASFSCRSTNTETFERSTAGSNGFVR